MQQISGALVGIALVLTAVLLPMAFFSGSTGVIYRQFSITIVTSMVLSVLVALIFTPALCATLLKKPDKAHHEKRGPFGWFNRNFDRGNRRYIKIVGAAVRHPGRSLFVFGGIVAIMAIAFLRIPTGFLPDEDQGVMFIQVTSPPGATLRPDPGGARRDRRLPPHGRGGLGRRRVRGQRLQLRRPRPECRPRFRPAQGLEPAARRP
ncbi:MAG: efflux RND transporter permease subunit [Aliidongia sp.]